MSPAPRLAVESTKGRLPVPPAELSCRTRLETRFTRMLGLPTFSNAFLHSSAFKVCLGFFFSSRRRHTRLTCDWSSDVCSSDLFGGDRRRAAPHAAGKVQDLAK